MGLDQVATPRNPHLRQYTWRQKIPLIQSRLDLWLVRNSLQDGVTNTGIFPAIGTDHLLVFLDLDNVQNNAREPSHWKFDNSLCDDVVYCRELNKSVPAWIILYIDVEDERILWELMNLRFVNFLKPLLKRL